jgi:hypothetical protein
MTIGLLELSASNPFRAGSPFKPDGLNNPLSPYDNPYSNQSATNPYATDAPRLLVRLSGLFSLSGYLVSLVIQSANQMNETNQTHQINPFSFHLTRQTK